MISLRYVLLLLLLIPVQVFCAEPIKHALVIDAPLLKEVNAFRDGLKKVFGNCVFTNYKNSENEQWARLDKIKKGHSQTNMNDCIEALMKRSVERRNPEHSDHNKSHLKYIEVFHVLTNDNSFIEKARNHFKSEDTKDLNFTIVQVMLKDVESWVGAVDWSFPKGYYLTEDKKKLIIQNMTALQQDSERSFNVFHNYQQNVMGTISDQNEYNIGDDSSVMNSSDVDSFSDTSSIGKKGESRDSVVSTANNQAPTTTDNNNTLSPSEPGQDSNHGSDVGSIPSPSPTSISSAINPDSHVIPGTNHIPTGSSPENQSPSNAGSLTDPSPPINAVSSTDPSPTPTSVMPDSSPSPTPSTTPLSPIDPNLPTFPSEPSQNDPTPPPVEFNALPLSFFQTTKGIIILASSAGVFVLLVSISLFIYCCHCKPRHRRRRGFGKPQYAQRDEKSDAPLTEYEKAFGTKHLIPIAV